MTEARTNRGHDHDHGDPHAPIVADGQPSYHEIMETAIRELLVERGHFTEAEIHRQIDLLDSRTPALGAAIVARCRGSLNFPLAIGGIAPLRVPSPSGPIPCWRRFFPVLCGRSILLACRRSIIGTVNRWSQARGRYQLRGCRA